MLTPRQAFPQVEWPDRRRCCYCGPLAAATRNRGTCNPPSIGRSKNGPSSSSSHARQEATHTSVLRPRPAPTILSTSPSCTAALYVSTCNTLGQEPAGQRHPLTRAACTANPRALARPRLRPLALLRSGGHICLEQRKALARAPAGALGGAERRHSRNQPSATTFERDAWPAQPRPAVVYSLPRGRALQRRCLPAYRHGLGRLLWSRRPHGGLRPARRVRP